MARFYTRASECNCCSFATQRQAHRKYLEMSCSRIYTAAVPRRAMSFFVASQNKYLKVIFQTLRVDTMIVMPELCQVMSFPQHRKAIDSFSCPCS